LAVVAVFCTRIQELFVPSNSPVLSSAIRSFADLDLRKTTHDALARVNITTPTPIQAGSLPVLLAGRDLIGQSRTGSGKTLAFGIPAVESVDPAIKTVQVLVLTPTRELAVQVGAVLHSLAEGTGIKTVLVYGGRAMGPQKDALRRGAQIVVGTPGRVADLYGQGDLRLDNVRFLVLDEADEMLDRGFGPQVTKILSWTPRDRQTALFSATMPAWVDDAARKHLRNPEHVAIQTTPAEAPAIDHVAYDVPTGGKMDALKDLLDARGEGQVIVFGRTKHGVKKLAKQLLAAGYPVAALQGNMSQNARDAVMADFRAGKIAILLATNVAARGIDVSAVDHVINFELPESSELLQHRIGRTGRMGRTGSAVTLLTDEDSDKWRQLMRGLGKQIPRKPWTGARRTDAAPRVVEGRAGEQASSRTTGRRGTEARRREVVESHSNAIFSAAHSSLGEASSVQPGVSTPGAATRRRSENGTRKAENRRPKSETRPESNDSRERRPSRREQQPAATSGQRRETGISVISEMIRERRSGPQQANRPSRAQAPEANGSSLRGSFMIEDLIDQEKFAFRNRGVSRHSERKAELGTIAPNGTGRPSFPVREERPQESAPVEPPVGEHIATCTNCGGTATLKFAPDLSRPIYCDACYSERRKNRRRPSAQAQTR
jgi:ATP-dependent RNA helicase DeaD